MPPGLRKVGLEDPHFEKIFEVFGDDQVEARAILTPVFMEELVALETAYAGLPHCAAASATATC